MFLNSHISHTTSLSLPALKAKTGFQDIKNQTYTLQKVPLSFQVKLDHKESAAMLKDETGIKKKTLK